MKRRPRVAETVVAPKAGSCPFGHGAADAVRASASAAAADEDTAAELSGGKCPFGHGGSTGQQPAADASLDASIDGVPPFGPDGGSGAAGEQRGGGEAGAAVCPFGFGGGGLGPRMTELHCVLCR